MQTTESVPAVERALAILEMLDSSKNGLSVGELSRKLTIPRSSAHAITLTLERCGYLTRNSSQRKCRLSSKTYILGHSAISQACIANAALLPMKYLTAKTALTSHLAMLEGNQATYIQKVAAPSAISMDTFVGKRTNLHCTAVGKVLISYAPDSCRQSLLARGSFARYTPNTIASSMTLREEVKKVLNDGFALDDQEEELEMRCVAVPVFSERGDFIAALSVSGNVSQIRKEGVQHAVMRLRNTARLVACRVEMEIESGTH